MKYKKAYIWGILGKFAPQGIYLISTMMLARILSPDDFGKIGVLSIIFTVANVLLDSGLGGSLIKEKYISKIDCSSIFVFNLFLGLLIYLSLFLLADSIELYFEIDDLSSIVKSISLVFPITALGIVPKALLQRSISFKVVFINSLMAVIIASFVAIIIAFNGGGVYSLVLYQIVNGIVTVLSNTIASKFIPSFQFSFFSLKRLLPFGIYTSLITIVDTIYENLLISMTGKYMNVQQAGYLYQAKRIEETMSTSLAMSISTVAFPILTQLKDDHEKFEKEAMETFNIITCLSFPILVTIAIFSTEVMTLLFGNQWIESSYYLKLLTVAGLFLIMETLIRNFIKSLCQVRKLLYATLFKRILGILIIIGALVVNPEYMIYAYIISTVLGLIINIILYVNIFKVNFPCLIRNFLNAALPCIIYFCFMEFYAIKELTLLYRIITAISILAVYYLIFLPRTGIKIIHILRK